MNTSKIYQEFIKNVKSKPNRLAGIFLGESVSYTQLKNLSDDIDKRLIKITQKDYVVGLCLERSIYLLASIVSILKNNYAFLLIDPSLPNERITYMLQDAGVNQVICSNKNYHFFKNIETVINLDEIPKESEIGLTNQVSLASDLAYVVYTSGSTGRPKGVMIEHKAIWNRLDWMKRQFKITDKDVILHKTSLSFDVSIWELLLGIISGANTCFLSQGDETNMSSIIQTIKNSQVTIIHFVPSMFSLFLDYVIEHNVKKDLSSILYFILSGEKLQRYLVEKYHQIFLDENRPILMNLYGPAEAAIDVTYYECKKEDSRLEIPIGKEIDGVEIYILDEKKQLCPIDVMGELYISGKAVGRGYINNITLSDEVFSNNPYKNRGVMYKTGDFGRRAEDGNIYFMGRKDRQVKIHGIRVESEEIESKLLKYPSIRRVIVGLITEEENRQKLVAYYESEKDISLTEIRKYAEKILPKYMIPSKMIRVNKFPETIGGKIDYIELETLYLKQNNTVKYIKKISPIELSIKKIWEEVLNINDISPDMDYFDLGGDSIDAIRISTAIEKIGYKCGMQDIYYNRTIQKLSQTLISSKKLPENTESEIDLRIKNETNKYFLNESEKINKNVIPELLQKLRKDETKYLNNLIKSGIKKEYSFEAYENKFRKFYRETYFTKKICFGSELDIKGLLAAIDQLVQSQGLLRSVLIDSGKIVKWREFNGVKNNAIPIIDLSSLTHNECQGFKNEVLVKYYACKNKLRAFPFRLLLIKNSQKEQELIYLMDESIHDQYSESLIEKIILNNYQTHETTKSASFSKYIKIVSAGPIKINSKEIIQVFNLEQMKSFMQRFENQINLREVTRPSHFYFKFPVNKNNLDKWALAVKLLCRYCEKEFGMEKIPIWMIHNCRNYQSNHYINTIGGFGDSIPCLVDVSDVLGSMKKIQSNIQHSAKHHIHFQNLYHSNEVNKKFKTVQSLLRESIGDIYQTKSVFLFDLNVNAEREESLEIMTRNASTEMIVPRWLRGFCFWVKFIDNEIHIIIHVPYRFNKNEYKDFFIREISNYS